MPNLHTIDCTRITTDVFHFLKATNSLLCCLYVVLRRMLKWKNSFSGEHRVSNCFWTANKTSKCRRSILVWKRKMKEKQINIRMLQSLALAISIWARFFVSIDEPKNVHCEERYFFYDFARSKFQIDVLHHLHEFDLKSCLFYFMNYHVESMEWSHSLFEGKKREPIASVCVCCVWWWANSKFVSISLYGLVECSPMFFSMYERSEYPTHTNSKALQWIVTQQLQKQ